jgi:hypothetical protein
LADESIFQGIVRNENSFTQLLYNLMTRDELFRKDVLSLFAGETRSRSTVRANIYIEKHLPNGGRADLLIENPDLAIIVEVKTEHLRGRTAKQLLSGLDDNPKSYLAYLESRRSLGARGLLVFLVPPDWRRKADLEDEIAGYVRQGRDKGVEVQQITWRDLLDCHKTEQTFNGSLWLEFHNLLERRFGAVRFQKSEINSMINGEMTFASVVKLTKLIDDVRKKAKAAGIMILPPQNVSLSKAVLMRKGGEDDEVKAGTLHA